MANVMSTADQRKRYEDAVNRVTSYGPYQQSQAVQDAYGQYQALQGQKPQGYQQGQDVRDAYQRYTTLQSQRPQTYQQSQAVQDAHKAYQDMQANKPGPYQSQYQGQIDALLGQITGRKPFQYDVNADMLYQNAKDQYVLNGQQAMMDTMGQAQAMTGGYGNTYAQGVGQQTYQQYLTQLNALLPEFYDRAYQRYRDEGDQLRANMSMYQDLDDTAYGRYRDDLGQYNTDLDRAMDYYNLLYGQDYNQYRDQLSQYNTDLDRAMDAYNLLYNQDYGRYQDAVSQYNADLNRAMDNYSLLYSQDYGQYGDAYTRALQAANLYADDYNNSMSQYNADRSYYNSLVQSLISQGKWPNADLIQAAGLTEADVEAFLGPRIPQTNQADLLDRIRAMDDYDAFVADYTQDTGTGGTGGTTTPGKPRNTGPEADEVKGDADSIRGQSIWSGLQGYIPTISGGDEHTANVGKNTGTTAAATTAREAAKKKGKK